MRPNPLAASTPRAVSETVAQMVDETTTISAGKLSYVRVPDSNKLVEFERRMERLEKALKECQKDE